MPIKPNYEDNKKTREYKDFDLSLTPDPVTGDVQVIRNELSVKRGIRNLLKTKNYERLFNPEIGSAVEQYLFEPISAITSTAISDELRAAIASYEPRASLINIDVTPDEDNNRYVVNVVFRLVNETREQQVEVILTQRG